MSSGPNKRTQKGTTFVEIVVYVGILGIILVFVISNLLSLREASAKIQALRRVDNAAELVLERIGRVARDADELNDTLSVFDNPNGELVVSHGEGTDTYIFAREGSRVVLEKTVTGPNFNEFLSTEDVIVGDLTFRDLSLGGRKAVRTELKVRDAGPTGLGERSYYSTIVLRGTY